MKVAYCVRAISPQHGFGGLERAATSTINHLLLRGVDVALFTRPLPAGQPFKVPAGAGGKLTVHAARYGRLPLRPNGVVARLTNYRAFVEDMGQRVKGFALRGDLDGIYAQGLCAWGVRSAPQWGVPLVSNPHGLEEFKVRDPLKRLAYAPFRAWVRAGCRAADRVVATDHAMRGEVATLLGIAPSKVVVIPNGVELAEAHALVNPAVQAQLANRWPQLALPAALKGISVGRLEANKGFENLLWALSTLEGSLGDGWLWFLVGEGSQAGRLRSLAIEVELDRHFIFAGRLSDQELHSLYAMCNLFAHPALYEGSSLVTLEAMSHALPVVASAVGGIPDKVVEGETGFLVSPGDRAQLAAKIAWMASHPVERAQMGVRGAGMAATFSWERIASMTEALFATLIGEKSSCKAQEVTLRLR